MFFQKKSKKLKTRDPAWYTTLQMRNVVILVISKFWTLYIWKMARRQCSKNDIVQLLDEWWV